ncbi:hypothetical protein EON67_10350, partial [archaeon]
MRRLCRPLPRSAARCTFNHAPLLGRVSRYSVVNAASAADSAENPWIVSEGERNFKLGEVRELEYAVQKLLLLEGMRVSALRSAQPRRVMRAGFRAWLARSPHPPVRTPPFAAVPTLRNVFPALDAKLANRRQRATVSAMACADASEPGTPCATPMGFINFTSDDSVIIGDVVRNPKQKPITRAYIRAGPRESLYFDPTNVRAAIVACGGLCPGMNNVVRELVNTLTHGYGVSTVYGLQGGFWGFWTPCTCSTPRQPCVPTARQRTPPVVCAHSSPRAPASPCAAIVQTDRPPQAPKAEPKLLTPEAVADIQHYGGVMLGVRSRVLLHAARRSERVAPCALCLLVRLCSLTVAATIWTSPCASSP